MNNHEMNNKFLLNKKRSFKNRIKTSKTSHIRQKADKTLDIEKVKNQRHLKLQIQDRKNIK